jgi:hypothetical protein
MKIELALKLYEFGMICLNNAYDQLQDDSLSPHIVKRKSLIPKDFFLPVQWEFQQMSRSYRHFRIKCV